MSDKKSIKSSPHTSDEEHSDLLVRKRRGSLPKLPTFKRKDSKEENSPITTGPDYTALIEAAKSSKSHKKLHKSATYATNKQVLELKVEYFTEITELNKRLEKAEKEMITLSSRLDRFERENERLKKALVDERRSEAGEGGVSNNACFGDWLFWRRE